MAYSEDQTFNLEAVNAEELWVTYSRPGLLPWNESKKFITTHKLFNTKRLDMNGAQTMHEVLNDTEAEFEWIMSLITSWNIPARGTGETLPVPSVQSDIWREVPGLYLAYIVETIKQDPTGSDFLSQGITISRNISQQ